MKANSGSRGIVPLILNPSIRCRCVVNLMLRPLYTQERDLCTPLTGGWVGPTASLKTLERRKYLLPVGSQTPDCPAHILGRAGY